MAARATSSTSSSDTAVEVRRILAWLERRGTARNRDGMAHYAIDTPKVFGVSMTTMRPLMRQLGRNHALGMALWQTGWFEARAIAAAIGDPVALTPALMDRLSRDFDNWATTDGACLHLFSRSPHAWGRVAAWRLRRGEFQRRAAFALLASLTVHDRAASDERFLRTLPWLVEAADDERPFVKKAVNWALRQIGKRNETLHEAAVTTAREILDLGTPAARWIARDALRELQSPAVVARLAARRVTGTRRRRHT